MRLKLFFLFLISSAVACKKDADLPPEIRPNDFWVRCTIVDNNGAEQPYEYRGEQKISIDSIPGLSLSIGYFSTPAIDDSIKNITSGLATQLFPAPFAIRLNYPERLSDPFAVPEWTKPELERILFAGKSFAFGDETGEAKLYLNDLPYGKWSYASTAVSNQGGYLRVTACEDYGSPEVQVPYFGKKVTLEFAGPVVDPQTGIIWTLKKGEAVLFFRYYKF